MDNTCNVKHNFWDKWWWSACTFHELFGNNLQHQHFSHLEIAYPYLIMPETCFTWIKKPFGGICFVWKKTLVSYISMKGNAILEDPMSCTSLICLKIQAIVMKIWQCKRGRGDMLLPICRFLMKILDIWLAIHIVILDTI